MFISVYIQWVCLIVSITDLCPLSYSGTLICKFRAILDWLNGDSEIDNIWLAAEKRSKYSIFHNFFKYVVFKRRQKALLLSKGLRGNQRRQMQ